MATPLRVSQQKKLTLDTPLHDSPSTNYTSQGHTSVPPKMNLATKNITMREPISQPNTIITDSLNTIPNDPSFLEKILAGVQTSQPNLNTYTQVTL